MSRIQCIGTVVIALILSSATRADDKRVLPSGGEKVGHIARGVSDRSRLLS